MACSTVATSATVPSSADPALQVLELHPVPFRGSRLARGLLRLGGWEVRFQGLPADQGVIVVYPHTSNWDFVVGVLAKWSIGLPLNFWGKDSLFRIPLLAPWLRWLGGIPVDRQSPGGIVGQMAQDLRVAKEEGRFLWLALAPEGTRRHQPQWRSGFYRVALEADVPLGLAYIDYRERVVSAEYFVRLSGNATDDKAAVRRYLGARQGRHPAQAAPIDWNT